jgi:tetratricopeptide (TPR) repeat protein
MTPSDTSILPHLMHVMQDTPLLAPGDVHRGAAEMDEKVTYRQQVKYCGKPGCRKCQEGTGHGPYWYSYQVVDGRTIRTYIGKNLPPGVQLPSSQKPPTAKTGTAALRLAEMRQARKSLTSEIDELDRLLAADPTNEEAVQWLMVALLQSKRRGEALRAYQRLASVLRDGYKREPSAETRAVYEAVQRGDDVSSIQQRRAQGARGDEGVEELSRTQQGVQIGRSNQSPLVGREHELHILRQLLITTEEFRHVRSMGRQKATGIGAVTLETQHPQCMVLMGEAGIGKTRLAEETAREGQRRGWAVVWSHVYAQESGIPYRLWTEVLRRVIVQGLWQEQDVARRPHMFEPLEALLPEMHDLFARDGESEEAGGDRGRDKSAPYPEQLRLWEAVYEFLTTISTRMPLLIVLDDVQWADASSCELFGYLARRLHSHPIVLLMTCRENELTSKHTLRSLLAHMQREHAVETLHVKPLTDAQVGTLVAASFNAPTLPEPMVRHIQTQAAGNPFFAEELAHSFRMDDVALTAIRGEPSQSLQSAREQPSMLPDTITAALNQRLNKLSEACQQLLGKAAVLGGSFGFHLLSAMEASGVGGVGADEDLLLDLLEEALLSGVLTEEGTGTRITYHFWHPLLTSHLYNRLSAARRARLHRRAAEVLQQVYATREGEQAAAITQHLVQGGAEAPRIARYAELAGNHAYGFSAYPEAERYYRIAVERLDVPNAGKVKDSAQVQEGLHLAFLLERLAECTRIQGNFKEARNLFEQVLKVRNASRAFDSSAGAYEAQQEAQIQALLWSEIGWTWRFTGDNARAQQCCEHGGRVLRDAGILTGPAWARLRFQQSSIHWQQGNYEEARRAAQEALRLFEESLPQGDTTVPAKGDMPGTSSLTRIRRTLLGDPVDLGRAHTLLGAIASATGQRSEALEYQNKALAIYELYDRQREIAHVSCNIGYLHLKKAEYTVAQAFLHRSFGLAERIGDVPLMSVVFHNLGELAAASGNLQEAETLYKRSLVLAEQVEDREYMSLWNADLASVLLAQGNLAEAVVCVGHALTIGRAIRNAPCLGLALVTLGNLRIAQAKVKAEEKAKELVRARRSLRHALALQGLEVETKVRGQLALAEVSLLMGEREVAREEAVRVMEEAQRSELVEVFKDCERLLEQIG